MKSNSPSPLYFSPLTTKTNKRKSPAASVDQSPYLKAVLSDKRNHSAGRSSSVESTSLAAALRYIAGNK